jgi:hypothetical protein
MTRPGFELGPPQWEDGVGHLRRGISPTEVRYLHTEQYKHRINARIRPCLEWDSNPRSQCLSASTVVGLGKLRCVYKVKSDLGLHRNCMSYNNLGKYRKRDKQEWFFRDIGVLMIMLAGIVFYTVYYLAEQSVEQFSVIPTGEHMYRSRKFTRQYVRLADDRFFHIPVHSLFTEYPTKWRHVILAIDTVVKHTNSQSQWSTKLK